MLSTALTTTERQDKITYDECLRDEAFSITSSVNGYLAEHPQVTNGFIIYSSMLMDYLIISLCVLFLLYWRSFRVVMTYILFFGIRAII